MPSKVSLFLDVRRIPQELHDYVSQLNLLCCSINRQRRYMQTQSHCATGQKETANKSAAINQTTARRRQMIGCTCVYLCVCVCVCMCLCICVWVRVCVDMHVWVRQLCLPYLLNVDLPRCCLWGLVEGGTVGTAFFFVCVCVRLDVRLSEGQTDTFRECVFFCTRVSVPACNCTCHVMPSSKQMCTVNLTLCLKAVGMGRDKENYPEAEEARTCAFFSYRKSANAKVKQRNDILCLLFTLFIRYEIPLIPKFMRQTKN